MQTDSSRYPNAGPRAAAPPSRNSRAHQQDVDCIMRQLEEIRAELRETRSPSYLPARLRKLPARVGARHTQRSAILADRRLGKTLPRCRSDPQHQPTCARTRPARFRALTLVYVQTRARYGAASSGSEQTRVRAHTSRNQVCRRLDALEGRSVAPNDRPAALAGSSRNISAVGTFAAERLLNSEKQRMKRRLLKQVIVVRWCGSTRRREGQRHLCESCAFQDRVHPHDKRLNIIRTMPRSLVTSGPECTLSGNSDPGRTCPRSFPCVTARR